MNPSSVPSMQQLDIVHNSSGFHETFSSVLANFTERLNSMQVKMTTGATIHTTEGLKMTVTRRTRPPIVPTLEVPTLKVESPVCIPEADPVIG